MDVDWNVHVSVIAPNVTMVIYGIYWVAYPLEGGARCSSMVEHLLMVMGYQNDPSWWTHQAISHYSQCSTIGVTKVVLCAVFSVVLWSYILLLRQSRVRCSSVVRAFTHGAIGRRIDPLWWTHWAISRSSQCSTTGVTKTGMCNPGCGIMHIEEPLLLIEKSNQFSGFLSSYLNGSLPYVRCHITISKMCWVRC